MNWHIENAGPEALLIYFGHDIEAELVDVIRRASERIRFALSGRILDLVPSYTSLMLHYDVLQDDYASIRKDLEPVLAGLESNRVADSLGKEVQIPVYYSAESGPDLLTLANDRQLSVEQLIEIHSQTRYLVYTIGFAPAFAYLGNVDPRIAAARLNTPRTKVPAGSVGIAEQQTAVYPIDSPGGWNIIGRTPVSILDRNQEGLTILRTGDWVRFVPISRSEYLSMGGSL